MKRGRRKQRARRRKEERQMLWFVYATKMQTWRAGLHLREKTWVKGQLPPSRRPSPPACVADQ